MSPEERHKYAKDERKKWENWAAWEEKKRE
jgi:hypothetical protein